MQSEKNAMNILMTSKKSRIYNSVPRRTIGSKSPSIMMSSFGAASTDNDVDQDLSPVSP